MHSSLLILLLSAPSTETATRSLSLADAVALALETAPAVGEAHVGRDRAELAVFRAQLDRFSAKLDANLQEIYAKTGLGRDSAQQFSGALGLSNLSASINVPVFSGFRVEANVDRAKQFETAAHEEVKTTRRDVALAAARAYWTVRKISLLYDLQISALERFKNAEEIAASRVRAGLAPPIDQNRAASRRLQQEVTLADLRGQLKEASAQLAVALGLTSELTLTEPTHASDRLPPMLIELLETARASRPELASARARLAAQNAAVTVAKSAYYPQLSAFTLFQYGNNTALAGAGANSVGTSANPFRDMAGDFQAGVVLSMNFFDTLNTDTSVRDARFEEERLGLEIERVERTVDSDVRGAHARVVRFHDVETKLSPAREVARDNVEIVQKRYENGEAAVFELLDSEIELLNIERQITDSASELSLAWLELDASLGTVVGE